MALRILEGDAALVRMGRIPKLNSGTLEELHKSFEAFYAKRNQDDAKKTLKKEFGKLPVERFPSLDHEELKSKADIFAEANLRGLVEQTDVKRGKPLWNLFKVNHLSS